MLLQNAGFVTALEYSDMRKMVFRISSGSAELEYENYLLKYLLLLNAIHFCDCMICHTIH